jgi:hypothetical protein
MPIGPFELLYCLVGLIIIPGGVAIAAIARHPEMTWSGRIIEGLKYAASAALVAVVIFILLVLVLN